MSEWDRYFLEIARTVSSNSKCISRRVGAVLVRDKAIISTGYNGPPRDVPHCSERYSKDEHLKGELQRLHSDGKWDVSVCPRKSMGYASGEGIHLCTATHAEANAIVQAARSGVSTHGSTLYIHGGVMPCRSCVALIINAGIRECVVDVMRPYDETSLFLLDHSHLIIRAVGEGVGQEASGD